MTDDLLKIGKAQASWNVAGTKILKYSVEMFHKGLNDHKVISAPDIGMLQNKANLQAQKWSDIWETLEDKRKSDEQKEASIEKATTLTEEAEKAVADIDNLLIHTLDIDDTIQWESLKRTDDFSEPIPNEPKKKKQIPYPDEPKTFELEFTFLEKLFKAKHERRIAEHECKFQARLQAWTDEKKSIDQKNRSQDQEHENNIAEWKKSVSDWEIRRQAFIDERSAYNQKIDSMKSSYLDRNQDSVVEYCDIVLESVFQFR